MPNLQTSDPQPSTPRTSGSRWVDRASFRFLAVTALVVGLLIPLLMVGGVASERQSYYQQTVYDIAQGWGGTQHVQGPMLVVPATNQVVEIDNDGKERTRAQTVEHVILPENLHIQGQLSHQYRRRAIYQVPVYLIELALSGSFAVVDRAAIEKQHQSVHWDQARVVIGISDTRGVKSASLLQLAGQSNELEPGTGLDWLPSGVHAGINMDEINGEFALSLKLAGTDSFSAAPLGTNTKIDITGSWPHPKFQGQFLPIEHKIDETGFTADWQVSALARGIPDHFEYQSHSTQNSLEQLTAGISLHDPVTIYTTVDRGIKYGILFVALTFITFLCFELTTGVRFHFVQYGVVGVGLIIFYLTLLSLSEHLAFMLAYLIASGIIIAMLTSYAWAITRRLTIAVTLALVEVILYWVLYVLLQLEDLALITGTGVLLVGLAAVMYVTRSLNSEEV